MTTAFLYKWTHIPSGRWYIGSRTAKGCHPSDGYICSSRVVKPMILENKSDWNRDILVIGNPKDILRLERAFLNKLDARHDPLSFNLNNCTPVVKLGPRPSAAGKNNHFFGQKHTPESIAKIKAHRECQLLTPDRNAKISKTMIGHSVQKLTREKFALSVTNLPKKVCPHCNKSFLSAHYGRFHGDKCKEKQYV